MSLNVGTKRALLGNRYWGGDDPQRVYGQSIARAYYSCADVSDRTANGLTATNNNLVTFPAGLIGNDANFVSASSQYLSRAITAVINTPRAIDFFLGTGSGTTWHDKAVISWHEADPSAPTWLINFSGGSLRLYHGFDYRVSVPLAADSWYHVACSFDGDVVQFWVEGELEYQDEIAETGANPTTFWMGNGFPTPYQGMLGEVGIYSQNLTPAYIAWRNARNSLYLPVQ